MSSRLAAAVLPRGGGWPKRGARIPSTPTRDPNLSVVGVALAALRAAPFVPEEARKPINVQKEIAVEDDMKERADRITFSARNAKKDVFQEVDIRVREKRSNDAKLSYRDAVHMVFKGDPDLHRLYLDTIPPMRAQK